MKREDNVETFVIEEESEIQLLHSKEEIQKIEDSVSDKDPSNLDDNYILIPTKLPTKILFGLVANLMVLIIGATIFYVNVTSKLDTQGRQIESLLNNVYTKDQADSRIRNEVQVIEQRVLNSKLEEMREALKEKR